MRPDHDHLPRPDLTPLIDVVFQLLVFFLVSMKFKTLDMKIEAELPRRGLQLGPHPPRGPLIEARLTHAVDGGTSVRLGPRDLGAVAAPATYRRLVAEIRAVRARHVGFGNDPAAIEAEVDAGALVPTGDVVRTIDAFLEADLPTVTFVGTPPRGTGNR